MLAAKTYRVPVIGVPVMSRALGIDSLLSIVNMPFGVPVATMAISKAGAGNAAILAATILGGKYKDIQLAVIAYRKELEKHPLEPFEGDVG